MISNWIELDTVNGFLEIKFLDNLIISIVNDVNSSFLASWKNIVSFTSYSVDIRLMYIFYLLAKTANSEIPYTDFFILSSRYTDLVILKGYILNFFMPFESCDRLNDIRGEDWAKLSFDGSTFYIKKL